MTSPVTCANCGKAIFKVRKPGPSGAWYHHSNASVSCYPGAGSAKRAEPRAARQQVDQAAGAGVHHETSAGGGVRW